MRTLVAMTCIAVIAAVSYYFVSEFSRYRAAQAQIAAITAGAVREGCVADVVAYQKHMTETVSSDKYEKAKPLRAQAERCASILNEKFGMAVVVDQYGARLAR